MNEQLQHGPQDEREDRRRDHRGRLKVFLGYASGVGKSVRLIEEAMRRRTRGQDVVIAAPQRRVTPDVVPLLDEIESIPTLTIEGTAVLDIDAILMRNPQICVVDGLAYDNPEGAKHKHRWQDVDELLHEGISVLTSVNIQYIWEQHEAVERLTGKQVREFVPQHFLMNADEVVLVDAPADMLIEQTSDVPGSLEGGERNSRLAKLRELALVLTASVVDQSLDAYLRSHDMDQTWRTQERILLYLTPGIDATKIIAAGKRNMESFHADLVAVYVHGSKLAPKMEKSLAESLSEAHAAGARVTVLESEEPDAALVEYARAQRITQIFVGLRHKSSFWARLFGTSLSDLVNEVREIDVRVIPV